MAKNKRPIIIKQGVAEYMATYGDLVTLLLCFFILLFAMSSVDASKFAAVAASMASSPVSIQQSTGASESILTALGNGIIEMPSVQSSVEDNTKKQEDAKEELSKMASDFRTYFAENQQVAQKIEVEENETNVTLVFKDGVLFDSGSDVLRSEALSVLEIVTNEILKYPDNDIKIEGHTDNRPINTVMFRNNWYLSGARAISVAMYFTDQKGFAPTRVSTEGFGEYRPRATNDTPEGRSQNRRVEIKIISKYYSGSQIS